MKFNIEIKSWVDAKALFSVEVEADEKLAFFIALELAVRKKVLLFYADLRDADLRNAALRSAALRGANLCSVDLRSADLRDANLRDADLCNADLCDADLRGADLRNADLRGADLRNADLRGANLSNADLRGADLRDTDLRSTNLRSADLRGADLRGVNLINANLRGAKGINKFLCTPLLILYEQTEAIRAYKLVNAKNAGPFKGGIIYEVGKEYSVENANSNETIDCGAGINLATLDWCIKNYQNGYKILVAEFRAEDIATIPVATDGRFRVRHCKIVGEKILEKIGIVDKK
jgi:hypothetical protein